MLTVEGNAVYVVDTRKGSVFTDDFGRGSFHNSILVARQWTGE